MPFDLDPNIPLSARGVTMRSPLERLMAVEQMDLQRENMQALADQRAALARQREMELGLAQQEAAESEALRTLFAKGTPSTEAIYRVVGPERGTKIVQGIAALQADQRKAFGASQEVIRDALGGLEALPEDVRAEWYPAVRNNLLGKGVITPDMAPETYDPNWFQSARNYGRETPKPQGLINVPAGGVVLDPQTRQPVFTAPTKPEPEKTHSVTVMGPGGRPMRRVFTESELRNGVEEYRAPSSGGGSRFWVMRDGKPVRISEEEYRLGDAPASTREQGRPVTSGDANKIADIDTSLDDLNVLDKVLSTPKATGVEARIRATLPDWANELSSGWGTEAKQRQAVIDRVKQVIGKALEEGVLRKEDEAKYARILPTIGDTPEVAQAKIKDLRQALVQRRVTQLDALEDAGYEVNRFRSRETERGQKTDPMGIR